MSNHAYIKALKRIALAYLIITINLNLDTLNIIPNWIGYLLFYKAVNEVANYEKSAQLLRPLIICLGLYEFLVWILMMGKISIDIYVIEVIITAISLYFHFQLLTNLADIARRHQSSKSRKIILCRTIRTLTITVLATPINWSQNMMIILIIINLLAVFYLSFIIYTYSSEEKSLNQELSKC